MYGAYPTSTESKTPFFAIIQTAANHRPYTIPGDDPDFKVVEKPEVEVLANGMGGGNPEYNAIRLMDHSVAKFMDKARQSTWFDNTVFVFLGDHGTIGDVPSYMPAWMQAKDIASIHTPLILYAPKFLKQRKFETIGQQSDLLPTLIDISGRSTEQRGLGRSLVSERPGQEGMLFSFHVGGSQYGWFDGRYYAKLLDSGNAAKASKTIDQASKVAAILARVQLYDLSDVSKHQTDIAAQEPQQVQRLGSFLEAYYQTARYLVMNP
jgi:phosphoglycerol transferase MdoB-like AlkP superfamily enzyme